LFLYTKDGSRYIKNIHSEKKALGDILLKRLNESKHKLNENGDFPEDHRKDLMDCYVESLAKKEYTVNEFVEDFETYLIAGYDATSSGMSSIIFYLKKYPEVEKKVIEEIHSIFDKGTNPKDLLNNDPLEKMKGLDYMNMVIKEGLRLNNISENTGIYSSKK
jgi:cytochrome P450